MSPLSIEWGIDNATADAGKTKVVYIGNIRFTLVGKPSGGEYSTAWANPQTKTDVTGTERGPFPVGKNEIITVRGNPHVTLIGS